MNFLKVKIYNLDDCDNLYNNSLNLICFTLYFRNKMGKKKYRCDLMRNFLPYIIFSNVIIEFKNKKIYNITTDEKSEIINLSEKKINFDISLGSLPYQFIDNITKKNLLILNSSERDIDIDKNNTGTLYIIEKDSNDILFKYSFLDATNELKKKNLYNEYRNFPKHFDSFPTIFNFKGKKYLFFRMNMYFGDRQIGMLESNDDEYNFKNLNLCTFKKCYPYCYHFLHFFYNNELYVVSHNYIIKSIHDSTFSEEGIFISKAENINTFVAIHMIAHSKNTRYSLELVGYDMVNHKKIFYKNNNKLIEISINDDILK